MLSVVEVPLDPDVDSLLSQMAMDSEMTRSEYARVVLESSLIMSLAR